MKIYYAHCQSIYRTKQEQRDLDALYALAKTVVNPSDIEHSDMAAKLKDEGKDVKADVELDPGVARRVLAALVRRQLLLGEA